MWLCEHRHLDGIFGKFKLGKNNGADNSFYARRLAAAVYMMLYWESLTRFRNARGPQNCRDV
jgi:hypothetical protein